MASTEMTRPGFEKIFSQCSNKLCDYLWKQKSKEILRELLHDSYLDMVVKNSTDMERMLVRSRKSNNLETAFYVNLKKKIYSTALIKSTCELFFLKKYQNFDLDGDYPELWISLILLHFIGLAMQMPEQTFPSEEEITEVLSDEAVALHLWERLSSTVPFAQALCELECFSSDMAAHAKHYDTIRSTIADQTVEDMEDVTRINSELLGLRVRHRSFLKRIKSLRSNLSTIISQNSEDLPALKNCLSSSGLELALMLQKRMDIVREELLLRCKEHVSPKFDANALRALIDRIFPPLISGDIELAENEIAKLEEGTLSVEHSPLIKVIIPAIKGELEINEDQLDEEIPEFFNYSHGLIRGLKKGQYSFKEDTVSPVQSENCDAESEPEPVIEDKPTSVPVPEPEPEFQLSHGKVPDSIPDNFQEPMPEQSPVTDSESTVTAEDCSGETTRPVSSAVAEVPPVFCEEGCLETVCSNESAKKIAEPPITAQIRKPVSLAEAIREIIAGVPLSTPLDTEDDVRTLFQQLIVAKDSCALYWLAKTLGESSPIPAWLLELVHLGTHYRSGMVGVGTDISTLCDLAAERMEELDEKQKLLLATAILRPALMMSEQPLTMEAIANALSSSLNDGYGLKVFMDALLVSIRSGKTLDDAPSEKMTRQIREAQRKRLIDETERLLILAQKGKTSYQPATALKKKLFHKNGKIGKLLHDCQNGKQSDLRTAVQHYRDDRNIQALIEPNIEAKARESILKDVRLAIKLVQEWINFFDSEMYTDKTFAEQQFDKLKSALSRIRSQLEVSPGGQWFLSTIDNIYEYPKNDALPPDQELRLWPLRLACAKPEAENVFEKNALTHALRTSYFENDAAVTASLAIHAALGTITTTQEFLDCFPHYRAQEISHVILEVYAPVLSGALPFTLTEVLDTSSILWQEAFEQELEKVKEYLGDSYFRGAILYDQQSRINAEISEIMARYGEIPDKAQGILELRKLFAELKEWNESSLDAVNIRIDELDAGEADREARSFLSALRGEVAINHVFSAAWDNIARLEQYLLHPGQSGLPELGARKSSGPETARVFYGTEPSYWAAKADKDSVKLWEKLGSLQGKTDGRIFLGVTTELQRWLGFVLSSEAQSEEVFSDARPNHWRVRRYTMSINSPLPQWGSLARNRHTIAFGWNVTPRSISNLVTSGRIKDDEALTIVCCNSLSHEQRKEILRLSHSWRPVFPLVIDKNLFNFLAAQDDASRTEKLFEVALAGSPCNPYTPDVAGAVPREMFFGRENDKNSIFDPTDSCIIYGGRQLGKSALLEQIYQEHGSQKNSDTKVIKYTLTVQDTSILDVVIRNCVDAGLVSMNTTRNTFNDNIKKWINDKNGRRVLILLDECDVVLDEDSRHDFQDVLKLRNLMQDTSRSFKVVFTGLHSVQRFSHVPNSPLFHFGRDICIGPLSTDAAYELMTRPMRFLGLEFEDPQLVQMALNYCNYQPKLIQMFCRELVNGVEKIKDRQPVHIISKSTMLNVYDSHDLKTRIGECFKMTVSLDTRYLVIGYTMALHQGEKVSIGDLQRELRNYWPAAFSGARGDINTLQTLLNEMEGLGLIISLGGSYRLRTPNVAELLGGVENVLLELEQFYDRPYQPVANPDELRMVDVNGLLVASQHHLLGDKTNHLYWISGSRALCLEKIPNAVRKITEGRSSTYRGETVHTTLSGMSVAEAMKSLRKQYDRIQEGGLIAYLSSVEFPLMSEFMQEAERWLERLRTGRKYVKVICLVDPECLYEFIKNGMAERFSSYQLALSPWTKNSVEHWCKEKTLVGRDADTIIAETGGWPCLIGPMLEGEEKNWGISNLQPKDFIPKVSGIKHIVEGMSVLGNEACPENDMSELIGRLPGMSLEEFQLSLDTLKSLYVLRETSAGLKLDEIAGKVICGAPK